MTHRFPRPYRVVLLLVLLFGTVGCDSRPRAPVLRDEPVYQNDSHGLRFLAPEGWTIQAKADLPVSLNFDKERLLVAYRRVADDGPAMLEVTIYDKPDSVNLGATLAQGAFGSERWRQEGKPESLTIQGKPAERWTFVAGGGSKQTRREVWVFRRDARLYIFTGIFPSRDSRAREQVRRSIDSVTWRG